VLVAAAAGVAEVDVRHPVAVLAEKFGPGGGVQPGDERVASVETHRRIRGREQRREAGDIDEVALEVLGIGREVAFPSILVESSDGLVNRVDDLRPLQRDSRANDRAWRTAFSAPNSAAAAKAGQ